MKKLNFLGLLIILLCAVSCSCNRNTALLNDYEKQIKEFEKSFRKLEKIEDELNEIERKIERAEDDFSDRQLERMEELSDKLYDIDSY